MPEPCTCHLPSMTALFCIGLKRLGQAGARRQGPDITVSDITELGGRP
jgi:hypothetical protein